MITALAYTRQMIALTCMRAVIGAFTLFITKSCKLEVGGVIAGIACFSRISFITDADARCSIAHSMNVTSAIIVPISAEWADHIRTREEPHIPEYFANHRRQCIPTLRKGAAARSVDGRIKRILHKSLLVGCKGFMLIIASLDAVGRRRCRIENQQSCNDDPRAHHCHCFG